MSSHICHAEGCCREVPPKRLMCLKHWVMVPKHLKDAVWEHYVPGQEVTKTPSNKYLQVAQMAINAVAEKEGLR